MFFLDNNFMTEAVERAIKTAAQTALAFFVVGEVAFDSLNWAQIGGAAAVGAIASLLTSIASEPFGPAETPSLVKHKE